MTARPRDLRVWKTRGLAVHEERIAKEGRHILGLERPLGWNHHHQLRRLVHFRGLVRRDAGILAAVPRRDLFEHQETVEVVPLFLDLFEKCEGFVSRR